MKFCHYYSDEFDTMEPLSRKTAGEYVKEMTSRKIVSYDKGKEIQGDLVSGGIVCKAKIFIMPL